MKNPCAKAVRSLSKRSPKPSFEMLESRWNMTCAVSVTGSVLSIIGDSAANEALITQSDSTNALDVTCDGVSQSFESEAIKQLKIDLQGGDDYLSWGMPAGGEYFHSKNANIKLGDGHDEAWLDFRGGGIGGAATLYNNLTATVDGSTGDDELIAHFGQKVGGVLNLTAKMGDGNDEAFASMWGDIGQGAKVTFTMLGDLGNDQLSTWNTFDSKAYSYRSIDIALGSAFKVSMNGGVGDDTFNTTFGGSVHGKLNITEDGSDGNDRIEGDMYIAAGRGTVNVKFLGNVGNDYLRLYIDDQSDGLATVNALIDGGAGWDTGYHTPNVQKLRCELPFDWVIGPIDGGVLQR